MTTTGFKATSALLLASLIVTLSTCANLPGIHNLEPIQDIIAEANQEFYLDHRIWYQDVHAKIEGKTIILEGEAFFEPPVRGVVKRLRRAGYDQAILDSVTYLPETLENDLGYGVVIVPYVMGRYKPVDHKQEGTEMLYGEPVRLIRELDDYLQVQSSVGYLGYIPKSTIRRLNLAQWNRYHSGNQAVFTKRVILDSGKTIPLGTRLPYLGDNTILMPDGSEMTLAPENYRIHDSSMNPLRASIIASAEQFLGLPYVWGGRSSEGMDCSGFVMQAYGLNNIYLPRDTDEMANVGKIIGLPGWTEAMLPGDLMFFVGSRRLVTHTAIYLGQGKVIHSLGSGVQVQSMNPDDPDYAERLSRRFIFAKRIFE